MTVDDDLLEAERKMLEQSLIVQGLLSPAFRGHSVAQMQAEVLRRADMDRERGLLRNFPVAPGEPPKEAPTEARGFTPRQIRLAVQGLRVALGRAPSIARAAEELRTSESTLKRAVQDLRMGPWPPAPPDDWTPSGED